MIRTQPDYTTRAESRDELMGLLLSWADPRLECLARLQEIMRIVSFLSIRGSDIVGVINRYGRSCQLSIRSTNTVGVVSKSFA